MGEGEPSGGSGHPFTEFGLDDELRRAVGSARAVAFIVVFSGNRPIRVFAMERNAIVLGRDEHVDMRVTDASVSAHHARIVNHGEGFELEDLNSTNGTFVRGQRVSRTSLRAGDRVKVGAVDLMFLLDRPTTATVRLEDLAFPLSLPLAPPVRPVARPAAKNEDEVSLADLVRKIFAVYEFIRARSILIVACIVIGISMGSASLRVFPPPVRASTEVKLQPRLMLLPGQSEQRWQNTDEGSGAFVHSAERTLGQPALIVATLRTLMGKEPVTAQVGAVMGGLKVEEIGDHVFRLTYTDKKRTGPPPLDFLNVHVQGYVQSEISRSVREVKAKVDFLSDQLKSVGSDLAEVGSQRASLREKNSDRLPEDAAQTQTSRHTLEARRTELLTQVNQLSGELKAEKLQLQEDQPVARTRFQWSETYRQGLADVNRRLSEAYARGLAEGHPDVQRLKEERTRMQSLAKDELQAPTAAVVRESDPNYQQARRSIERLQSTLAAARTNLWETERALGRVRKIEQALPRVEEKLADLDHRQEATKQLHGELFSKLKQAEIQLNLEKVSAESRFEVTAPALERPKRSVLVLTRGMIGLIAGLALAGLIIFIREGRQMLSRVLAAAIPAPAGAGTTSTSATLLPGRERSTDPRP